MNLQQVGSDIFVSAQINIENVKTLAEEGFKTIVCNRPDKEDPHQPDFSIIQAEAQKYGIKAYHIPLTPPTIKELDIKAMKKILQTEPMPLLAYCHRGTRSMRLYYLACL
ncbi:TIGR01244 family sulfur transferase [Bartonella sp. B41]